MIKDAKGKVVSATKKVEVAKEPEVTPLDKFITKLKELGEIWYGSDNYAISSDNSGIKFFFKYPEKEITNGRQKRKMYDLIICFTFAYVNSNKKQLIFSSARGSRGIIAREELAANYGFSHMGSVNDANFCFGSGPLYDVMERKMRQVTDWINDPDYKLLEKALVLFDSYLSWESLDGGPYRRMGDIGSVNNRRRSFNNNELQNLIDATKALIKKNPRSLKISIRNDKFVIDDNLLIEAIINDSRFNSYIVKVNSRGEEIVDSNSTSNEQRTPGYSVRFGDKTYPAKFLNETVEVEGKKTVSTVAYPYLKQRLEKELNNYIYSEL